MSRTVRWTATILILVLLSIAAAQAAPLPGRAGAPASLFGAAWEWLASLFVSQEKEANPPGGEGGVTQPTPTPTPTNTNAGGEMDPNG
ncbi:MAG TPA: hypothetical protein VMW27_14695 [Thermoanaerobaculia bacterium]|nr:hypothetical protein [Thermoanaerobaculia bacterium]